jgi:hypothetical protein
LEEAMRRTKWEVLILTSALALTFLGVRAAAAPQLGKQESQKETKQSITIYHVSYKVSEVENGKTINSRSYALMAQPGKTALIRVGNRVPYSIGNNSQYQFQDVSMNIDCTVNRQEGGMIVDTRLRMATLSGKKKISADASVPVLGTLSLTDSTTATLGKPALVGSIDDVASNRHYVIEVTVTEAK